MIDGPGNFPKDERKNFKHRQYLQSSSYDTIIHTWISNKFSSIGYKHILIYRKYESWNLNHYIFNFHNLFVKYELCYGGLWITLYRHDFYVQSFVAKNMCLISHVWYEQSSKTHTKPSFKRLFTNNEMHFLCLTQKESTWRWSLLWRGIKKIDNTNCYVQPHQHHFNKK